MSKSMPHKKYWFMTFFFKIESNFCARFRITENVFKFLGQNIDPKHVFQWFQKRVTKGPLFF